MFLNVRQELKGVVINEMFDTVAFLCTVFAGASVIFCGVYLFYKYVLGIDINSTY
jgi:hypothetical protein